MRRLICSVALALASVHAADAGILTSAIWTTDVNGSLVNVLPIAGVGTSTATSISLSIVVGPTAYTQYAVVPITSMFALPVRTVFTLSGSAVLTANAGSANATMGIPGNIAVTGGQMTLKSGMTTYPASLQLVNIPISPGAGGSTAFTASPLGIPNYVTVTFFPWTPNTQTFMGLTFKGLAIPDATAMGSFNLTGMGGGTVTLVAPTRVQVSGNLLTSRRTATFTTLELHFVPEPSSILLLGAGGALLVRRASKQRASEAG